MYNAETLNMVHRKNSMSDPISTNVVLYL